MFMLKRVMKGLLPYGIIQLKRKWIKDHTAPYISPINQFMQDYRAFIREGSNIQYDSASKFRSIVSVKGYGRTGSSAIVDLLREYSSMVVLGYVDPYYSKAVPNKLTDEISFMRDAGGFAEVERFIGTKNRFQQDALLHRFILLITRSPMYKECPAVRPFFYQFFSDIAEIQEPVPDQRYYNKHLDYHDNRDIFTLKDLSRERYRELLKSLLLSVFNTFHSPGREILVLDQFLLDCDYSEQELKELIPDIKMIESIRDPRDVFYVINKTNVMWIPHDSPERFINWYRDRNIIINDDSEIKKTVRFEYFFENYDHVVSEIEDFLNVNAIEHTEKFKYFDPEFSKEGFWKWKADDSHKGAYALIEKELSFLCYNFDGHSNGL